MLLVIEVVGLSRCNQENMAHRAEIQSSQCGPDLSLRQADRHGGIKYCLLQFVLITVRQQHGTESYVPNQPRGTHSAQVVPISCVKWHRFKTAAVVINHT